MKKIFFLLTITALLPALSFSQLLVKPGTYFTTAGNVHLVLADMDYYSSGIMDAKGSTFHFTGSVNTTVGQGIDFFDFNNISIEKTTGKQIRLGANIYVDGQVNFVSGNIDLDANYLLLGNTGSFNGESEISRAFSTKYGLISANAVLNAPNAVNIANLGALITSNSNLGMVSITRFHHPVDLSTGGTGINRAFEFNPTNNSNLDATVTIKYFDAELNGLEESKLVQFYKDNNFVYQNKNYSARDASANFVTQKGYSNLFGLTLGNSGTVLPVSLTNFTAQCKGAYVTLNWKTATEQASDRFDVQRSTDGTTWEKMGAVKAAGSSTLLHSYQYNDNSLTAGTAFYRLAQYDRDGKFTYSSVVKGGCGGSTEFTVMPNPVSTVSKVVIGSRAVNTATLQLFNAAGQQVYRQAIRLTAGLNQYEINTTPLPGGAYSLIFTQAGAPAQTMRLLKQ